MLGLFKANPTKKIRKNFNAKLEEAMHAQRAGDMRKYAELSEQAEALRIELENLEKNINQS